ncbi:dihydrofolate reductase family protein [Solitalea sp. MAHUQ-68]|uniref:Dihydrofolate reductase family protein n=1 Tax=Solitalea agri TaxID=2953739 RepID=A0A9X2F1P0_9SPHI|nr:dihydrofolate reductase family protein [Solitalea agri]MCO4292530.1 dihydrofolate reductase family protein [Solitalea agri]
MAKLNIFNFITLNGFYKGPNEDINWHKHGSEENEFAGDMLQFDSVLLFGRVTYEMMASYWPTPFAMENDPVVSEGMNKAEKIVFSKTLKNAAWENTKILSGDLVEEVKSLKQASSKSLTVLGSGSIVSQLAEAGLIDEYQIMIDPVAIGNGIPIFNNVKHQLDLKLIDTKTFKSGVVMLTYQPIN